MDRLISEKQVINAIKTWAIPLQVSNSETIEDLWVNGVCELIKAIPSAEPKTGHWIEGKYRDDDIRYNDSSYKCDKCGRIVDFKENSCPNCGCRMVEQRERSE